MDLSIIIVNFNTQKLLKDCLQSIEASQGNGSWEIIVVDNHSTDQSISMVKKFFPAVKIIANKTNEGFAKANNRGVKQARGDYILLLNSDTIVKKDALNTLLSCVKQSHADIASCKLLHPNGTIQPQGGFLPRLSNIAAWMLCIDDIPGISRLIKPYQQTSQAFFMRDQQPGWVSGTALIVNRSTYNKLHGFDEHFFMYGEDVDFCLRAQKQGFRVNYFSQPEITHLGQGSGNSRGALIGEYKGLQYIFRQHKPAWELPILRILLKTGALCRILLFGIIKRDVQKKQIYQQAYTVA